MTSDPGFWLPLVLSPLVGVLAYPLFRAGKRRLWGDGSPRWVRVLVNAAAVWLAYVLAVLLFVGWRMH
jgi:hypothetical protein